MICGLYAGGRSDCNPFAQQSTTKMPIRGPFRRISALRAPKRVFSVCCAVLAFFAVVRLLVLVLEAYSAIRSERADDEQLVDLCKHGAAQTSARMRSACLAANAERASPILLKALLRAFRTAFADFVEGLSSPSRVIMLVLFVISGIAAPVVRALVDTAVGAHEKVDEGQAAQHVVVLSPGFNNSYGGAFPRLLKKRASTRTHSPLPFGDGFDADCEDSNVVELGL